ncbi:MAG: epoxyqueuosine reductase QueH, partial [Treponema sp.]|nr:epoxyqueuosine reductase QueH [Treponema sp.]
METKQITKQNFQKILDTIIDKIKSTSPSNKPTLLLHACCAPCSSYVIEYLSQYF